MGAKGGRSREAVAVRYAWIEPHRDDYAASGGSYGHPRIVRGLREQGLRVGPERGRVGRCTDPVLARQLRQYSTGDSEANNTFTESTTQDITCRALFRQRKIRCTRLGVISPGGSGGLK